jgi:hypothetical protein
MDGDLRSFRVALCDDRYVNPPPGGLDGVAVFTEAGWGVMQLPPEDYPEGLRESMLRDVAEQAEEFQRRGYDIVAVGECDGLAAAVSGLGMDMPDRIVPATAAELLGWLTGREEPEAARLLE